MVWKMRTAEAKFVRRGAKLVLLLAVLLGMTALLGMRSADAANIRPISDFVSMQGTFCFPDGSGGCIIFVPPVANFIGESAPATNRCASVDYAGLTNAVVPLGTKTDGTIIERPLADGRAEVTVVLHTTNA